MKLASPSFASCVLCAVAVSLTAGCAYASDPWYFQTDTHVGFVVPDKAQHFWGSWALAEKAGPVSALVVGVLWELYQDRKGDHICARDLLADGLGVLSAEFAPGRMAVVWDTETKTIFLRCTVGL